MKRLIITLVLLFGLSALSAQEGAAPAGEPRTDSVAASGDAATAAGERADDSGAESSAGSLWDRANTAYINGDYHAALEMYERILAGGMGSAKLYYNLANACFKEGQTGRAILFYHRALRLAPRQRRHPLQPLGGRGPDEGPHRGDSRVFPHGVARAVRRTMSCTAWSVLSLAALAFALGLFLLYLLAPRLSLRKAGILRHGGRCGAVRPDDVVRRGRTPRDARRLAGRGDGRLDGREEFARQVGDGPLRAARRDAREDFRPARGVVRNHHRRRQEGVAGV